MLDKRTILILITFFVYVCCAKSGDKSDPLTGNVWKLSSSDPLPGVDVPNDYMLYVPKECENDDRYFFSLQFLTTSFGDVLCPNDPLDNKTVTYSVNDARTILTIDGLPYNILLLNRDVLKLGANISGTSGFPKTAFIYVKAD